VWTLRHNEELCGLLEGTDIVKYSKFKWILLTYQKKSDEWEISWKKTCEKTTTEMGKQWEGLLAAEETNVVQ